MGNGVWCVVMGLCMCSGCRLLKVEDYIELVGNVCVVVTDVSVVVKVILFMIFGLGRWVQVCLVG